MTMRSLDVSVAGIDTSLGHAKIAHKGSLRPDCNDPPVNLGDLPTELIYQICDSLAVEDLQALRLTSRKLTSKATTKAFKNACHSGRCQLDEPGLTSLRALTRAGGLGCFARSIAIAGIAVAPKQRSEMWDQNPWEPEARSRTKAENALLDKKLLACREFEASVEPVWALKGCFDSLERHRPPGYRPFQLEIQAEIFDVRDGVPHCARVEYKSDSMPSTSSMPNAISEGASYAFRTVMRALLYSSLSVNMLSFNDPVLLSTFDDIEWKSSRHTGLKDIRLLEIRLRMGEQGAAGLNFEEAQECSGLHDFLSLPSSIRSISVMYQPMSGPCDEEEAKPTAPDIVFNSLIHLRNWTSGVICALHGLDISQDKLPIFVAHCPLHTLHLYDINLKTATSDRDRNAWQVMLEHPTFERSRTLQAVTFMNVSVNGKLDHDTRGKYVRSAGPSSRFKPARPWRDSVSS